MSSSASPASCDLNDEGRKKGSRGGKRSVSHLSKAQLARKRANDREAQRNIRARTKEHIENLERKVRELEESHGAVDGSPETVERVLRRNQQLEAEIQELRAQLQATQTPISPHEVVPELADPLLPPKVEWMQSSSHSWNGRDEVSSMVDTPVSNPSYSMNPPMYSTVNTSMGYLNDEASQQQYTPINTSMNSTPLNNTPIWDGSSATTQSPHDINKPITDWAFHPTFSQPSRFPELQNPPRFENIVNTSQQQSYPLNTSTSWQNQPFVYAWQISTKVKPPTNIVDQLMFMQSMLNAI